MTLKQTIALVATPWCVMAALGVSDTIIFAQDREWLAAHDIFPGGSLGSGNYSEATILTMN